MKSITAKVITISSQLLLVGLFFSFIFYENSNDENITVSNSNFDKMADKTLILFKKEEIIVNIISEKTNNFENFLIIFVLLKLN